MTRLNKNAGFTLIELIVAMLAGSAMVAVIVTYAAIGIHQFRDSQAETIAQEEVHIASMVIKDRLKEAKKYRVYNDDNVTALELLYVSGDDDGHCQYDCVFVCNRGLTDLYVINNGEADDLNFSFDSFDFDSLKVEGLVSNYISDFQVFPDELTGTNNMLTVKFESKVGKSKYVQSFRIRSRNLENVG